ncbi:putative porin [Flavobacterium caeni]|uniref:Putative porin n=1 Tax=Flavobacterium caeni TaxID=490189 RepID=A0A1G5J4J9_9FLAO|nr:putative porin [Flavobacterium caeni]SCY82608.1 Putative porin [Flavobacterium caeni]
MRIVLLAVLLLFSGVVFAQEPAQEKAPKSLRKTEEDKAKEAAQRAPITSYRIVTLERDTTYVDTSLTIKDEYEYNYLRKDIFGLLPFVNDGHTYNTLDYGRTNFSPYPEFGYKGKHFNYLEVKDIKYYSVATPLTELYFKTVMEQGQSVDALVAVNTSEQFNFSVAYRGIRSLGKYINQLTSAGNFRFTTSYHTKGGRYVINAHYAGQDMQNGENGGITTPEDFESKDDAFKQRQRLEVYLPDAKTFLKGKRVFLDHAFRINGNHGSNNLYVTHQFNYETKFFEYNQANVQSAARGYFYNYFGEASQQGLNDQVRYNRLYNKIGAVYENETLGKFQFFVDDFQYNYYYNSVFVFPDRVVPGKINDKINSVGGQYEYRKNNWRAQLLYSNSMTNQSLTNLDGQASYTFNEKNVLSFRYQKINKLPNHIYNLHQSTFTHYIWANNFKNEKINNIEVEAKTQWATASFQLSNINDMLYLSNDAATDTLQLISPKQYGKSIQYLSFKIGKEFKLGRFGLDNTVLYQKVSQDDNILNVPDFVTRNTLYYSDYFFKKALYLQTGVIFNYFTKYYANDYNPVLAEFFVQDQQEIGGYPMFDFFVNARVRTCRIFIKAEHFNSAWSSRNEFYAAPNNPYRDFVIRFGLVWNFFK